MPHNFPLAFWDAVVVCGTGAFLVASVLHVRAIRTAAPSWLPALVAFTVTGAVALAASVLLSHGGKALSAWSLGALFASFVHSRLKPRNSLQPSLVRGSA